MLMLDLGVLLPHVFRKRSVVKIGVLFCLLLAVGCDPSEPELILGNTMGTTYSVKIVGPVDRVLVKGEIEDELKRINELMSTYIIDSEISRFNQIGSHVPFELSMDNVKMLSLANELFQLSSGKFDITVGPLVNLWGFGPSEERQILPSQVEIDEARERVGMEKLNFRGNHLTKTVDSYIDFSAIAKGFGVDQIALILDQHKLADYLVEIGGEIRAKGQNHRGKPWRIAVEKPDVFQRIPFKAIDVVNLGMATSGDYRNYFEIDGVRFSHTIDPTTGRPITHNVASVTVLAQTTAMADGYATAINVMGADAGLAMAERQQLAVLVIIKGELGFEERYTTAFESYMKPLANR